MKPRVLVTRPEPRAHASAARLSLAGYEPLVLPLTRIDALAVPQSIPEVTAVAATSANAVRNAAPGLVATLSDTVAFAVGDQTAQAMREAGFDNVVSAQGDATSLAALVKQETNAGATIAYLCGRLRKPIFEAAMTAAGRNLVVVETYDTVMVNPDRSAIDFVLGSEAVDVALVYSSEGARALLGALGSDRRLTRTVFLCLSEEIAGLAAADGRAALAAESASDSALMDLLASAFPPAP